MDANTPDDPLAALQRRSRILERLLDDRGRVVRWPVRRAQQLLVLEHLAAQIEEGRVYTEAEIGRVLDDLHAFHDVARIRRELVELGLLQRHRDGSAYWKPSPAAPDSREG